MTPRTTWVLALVAVLVTVASASVLGRHWLAGPPPVTGTTAALGGMTAQLHHAEWLEMGHVHDGEGGFIMPDEMMPGAPRGDEVRLGISLTLLNTDRHTQRFTLVDEFTLTGGQLAEPRSLSADTIGSLSRLGPDGAVDGTLYFDVELPGPDDPPLLLQWSRDGRTVHIEVPLHADPPAHEHG
jgi:hypothetical protein